MSYGASGRAMLKAIVRGESDPAILADLAQKRLRAKLSELLSALTGCIDDHHRFLLRQWLELLEFIEGKIAEFDQQMDQKVALYQEAVTTWMAIPGIDRVAACCLSPRLERISICFRRLAISAHGQACALATTKAPGRNVRAKRVVVVCGFDVCCAKPPGLHPTARNRTSTLSVNR